MSGRTRKRMRHHYSRELIHKKSREDDGSSPAEPDKFAKISIDGIDVNDFVTSPSFTAVTPEIAQSLSEKAAKSLFEQARWHHNSGHPFCRMCGCTEYYLRHTREAYRCKGCGHDYTPTSGTIFCSRKVSFKAILIACAAIRKDGYGVAHSDAALAAGLGTKSVFMLALKLRGREEPRPREISLDRPRARDGSYLWTRARWSDAERGAVVRFAEQQVPLTKVAAALGRSPTSIAWYARDLRAPLPSEWAKLVAPKRKPKQEPRLAYPYVQRTRPSNADLLKVNDLVPKNLPEWIRADICQSIMLAMYEGSVEIAELVANKSKIAWFIKKFYKEQMPREEVSLEGRYGDDRDTYEIASSIAAQDWKINQQRDVRRNYESNMFAWYTEANQVDVVYEKEISDARYLAQEKGDLLSRHEVIQALDAGTIGHDVRGYLTEEQRLPQHARDRAGERYGILFAPGDAKFFVEKCRRAVTVDRDQNPTSDHELVFIDWKCTKDIPVVYNRRNNIVITVLASYVRRRRKLATNHNITGGVGWVNEMKAGVYW